jgi:PBP1b-binding outer membrane lipoprotein LpoB
MIKIFNKILVIIALGLFISGCNSVKKAFDPERKNSSQEFLVEKKSPLSMPPEFDELPIPSNENVDKESSISNIESLITEKNTNEKLEIADSDEDFERLILDKIKNN